MKGSRSIRLLLGGFVATVLLGVVLVFTIGGGPSASPQASAPAVAPQDANEIRTLFRGLPQRGLILGNQRAPVTLVEYVDLSCPYCRNFAIGELPGLISDYVRTGKLKIELRLVAFVNEASEPSAAAAFVAARQNRGFDFIHMLYTSQLNDESEQGSDELFSELFSDVGLSPSTLDEQAAQPDELRNILEENNGRARAGGAQSFPAFFVGRSVERARHLDAGSTDIEKIRTAIERTLPK